MQRLLTMGLEVLGPVAVALVILAVIFGIEARRARKEIKSIVVGEDSLTATRFSGAVVRMPWDHVREVLFVVKEPDPLDDDTFWVLIGQEAGQLMIRGDIPGSDQLLRRLQRFPGFDSHVLAEALTSVRPGKHRCWQQQEA